MAKFVVKIDTDNDAFAPDMRAELAAILRDLALVLENGGRDDGGLRDTNGNMVGYWDIAR